MCASIAMNVTVWEEVGQHSGNVGGVRDLVRLVWGASVLLSGLRMSNFRVASIVYFSVRFGWLVIPG